MTKMRRMRMMTVIWIQTKFYLFFLADEILNIMMTDKSILPSNDGRRLAGPASSLPYSVYQDKLERIESVKRSGGRSDDAHRKMFLSTGVITKAKGSAYIEQGATKIMAGVFGPKEVQRRSEFSVTGQLTVEFKFAPFSCEGGRRLGPRGEDREAEELGLVLAEALSSTVCLNKYPKSVIEVGVTVIEADGGVVAASLTAAGLALAEAGIHLCDLVVGVKVGLSSDNRLLVDPDREEEGRLREGGGEMTLGYLANLEQVVCLMCEGVMTSDSVSRALVSATNTASLVLPAVQEELVHRLKQKRNSENQK